MSSYATKQAFGGRRAAVTDTVVLAVRQHDGEGVCLRAGMVEAISGGHDRPYFRDPRDGAVSMDWMFRETRTVEEIEALPIGSWTWPIRVEAVRRNLPRTNPAWRDGY